MKEDLLNMVNMGCLSICSSCKPLVWLDWGNQAMTLHGSFY